MDVQKRPRRHRTSAGGAPTGASHPGRRDAFDEGTGRLPTQATELSVYVSRCSPRPVVTVIGALDACGAALLSAILDHVLRAEGRAAEVDLSRVDYADSHGLAPVLDEQTTIRQASPVVRRLLAALDRPLTPAASSDPLPT